MNSSVIDFRSWPVIEQQPQRPVLITVTSRNKPRLSGAVSRIITDMAIEVKIPEVGESITEVEIGDWLKRKGDPVEKDEPLVTLESNKATVELPAPASGSIREILKQKGQVAKIGEIIGYVEANGGDGKKQKAAKAGPAEPKSQSEDKRGSGGPRVMPAAQRLMAEQGVKPEAVKGTGPGGRILKEDVLSHTGKEQPDARPGERQPEKSQILGSDQDGNRLRSKSTGGRKS